MQYTFHPPRRAGLVFHASIIVLLVVTASLSFRRASQAEAGSAVFLYLLGFVAATGFLPLAAYRTYALYRAIYELEADGIRLRWGLRGEDIPMNQVSWVTLASELDPPPPLPLLRWPGAVRGVRRLPHQGEIEYMASTTHELVLIATPARIYAISPQHPTRFLRTFQQVNELGSLQPIPPQSTYPTAFLGDVWASRPARLLILSGLATSLALLGWVVVALPLDLELRLRVPQTATLRVISSAQLISLAVLNAAFYLVDLFLGLFYFRRPQQRSLAYLFWATSLLTSLLFFAAFLLAFSA